MLLLIPFSPNLGAQTEKHFDPGHRFSGPAMQILARELQMQPA